ncbi:MAG: hypothetical protein ACO3NL_07830, partial [Phycisphaerales bacterium]
GMGGRRGEEERRRRGDGGGEEEEKSRGGEEETNVGQASRDKCSASPSGSIPSIQSIPSK